MKSLISDHEFLLFTFLRNTINCLSELNALIDLYIRMIFTQREEKDDYAAEAQFVDEHGNVLARKVSHKSFIIIKETVFLL